MRKLRLYRKWWKTWGTLPVFPWLRAAALFKAGKYQDAIEHYRKGLDRSGDHPAELCARLDLAYCLFKVGRFELAEEELQLAATRSPNSREAQLRLAHFQIWTGRPLEAAWTMRRALRSITPDYEIVATFLHAALDGSAPHFLLLEAIKQAEALPEPSNEELLPEGALKLRVAKTRAKLAKDNYEEGLEELSRFANMSRCPIEALVAYGEELIKEGKIAFARQQLRRSLLLIPNHPRTLSLLAESYLSPGPFQNVEYAVQLATFACQHSGWISPREMHILAEAYFQTGDKMAALLMASKAKQAGSRLLGSYAEVKSLERLIESLSTGSLA